MLDPDRQAGLLRRIAEAALKHGLLVAPVGSVYFLFRGEARSATQDVDVVVHDAKREIAALDALEMLAKELGDATPAIDRASVTVSVGTSSGVAKIDLLRGKERVKGGFLPRALLRAAARKADIEGNVLWYPREYVLLLKADAAVDRGRRARSKTEFSQDNRRRAEAFRQDLRSQMLATLRKGPLREEYFRDALAHVKESRRREVARLLESVSDGRLRLPGP